MIENRQGDGVAVTPKENIMGESVGWMGIQLEVSHGVALTRSHTR